MKTDLTFRHAKLAALLLLLSTLNAQLSTAFAQGTAFTYQGRLNSGGALANGSHDLTFALFDAASSGAQQGNAITNAATGVTNGLFTVTLDFGNQFPGAARWLEIGVRTNGAASFTTVLPRQPLTPAPYAITAANVVSNGLASGTYGSAVTFNNAANSFTGNGAGLTSLNASNLTAGTVPAAALGNAWKITGNSGTTTGTNFLGTTDNQALELRVNGQRALRFEPNTNVAPNVIGGSPVNVVDSGVIGATIAGGGAANFFSISYTNRVTGRFGTVGGGIGNTAYISATVSGGEGNTAGDASVVGGGYGNVASDTFATVGGGNGNRATGYQATVSGGSHNEASGGTATIAGGYQNLVAGTLSFAAGANCTVTHDRCFMWSDGTLTFGTQQPNTFNALATGGYLFYTGSGVGVQVAAGGNAWSAISDRKVKENFAPVNCKEVLEKVVALPVTTWNLKTQSPGIRHIGAMAQDFKAAFQVGEDDRHISTSDADGVALAAIQGLNEKVEARSQRSEDKIQKLEAENAELKKRLDALEKIIRNRKAN